jgi:FkbM family methyltransferase
MISIYYGLPEKFANITEIVFDKCLKNDIIFISGDCDYRDNLFSDPIPGVNKYIIFILNEGKLDLNREILTFYRDVDIYFDTIAKKFYTNNVTPSIKKRFLNTTNDLHKHNCNDVLELTNRNNLVSTTLKPIIIPKYISKTTNLELFSKLQNFHKKLKLDFGMFYENMSMQFLIMKYINGLEKVLEIGGNIGRCSLLIANILNAKSNTDFVSLESNPDYAKQLMHNRDQNALTFHIENSALSKKNMIQLEDKTSISDVLVDGFFQVNIISWADLNEKYKIDFDTLIIDCNDEFYAILLDFPQMLEKMKLIIMKNEYYDVFKKIKIEKTLLANNFILEYSETGGNCPCYYSYYELWKAKSDE